MIPDNWTLLSWAVTFAAHAGDILATGALAGAAWGGAWGWRRLAAAKQGGGQ